MAGEDRTIKVTEAVLFQMLGQKEVEIQFWKTRYEEQVALVVELRKQLDTKPADREGILEQGQKSA